MSRFMERWQAAGSWRIDLGPDAPWSATGAPSAFDWLIITPAWTEDIVSLETLWSRSCYSGYVQGRERTVGGVTSYTGWHLSALWKDPDGKGPWDNSNVVGDGSDPRDVADDIWIAGTDGVFNTTDDWHNGLKPGTVYNTFSTTLGLIPVVFSEPRSGSQNVQTQSECDLRWGPVLADALRWWLDFKDKEDWFWRVNADRTVDLGPSSSLYRSTPAAIIIPGNVSSIEEPTLALWGATDFSYEEDWSGFASGAVLFYDDGTSGLGTSSTTRTTLTDPPWDYNGPDDTAPLKMCVMEIDTSITNVTGGWTAIKNKMLREARPRYVIRCSVQASPAMHTFARPGDNVWVYADSVGLFDSTNQVQVRGETVTPAKYPMIELDRPVQPGMGVYLIRNDTDASPRVVDLTPWVLFDDGPATVELGPQIKPRTTWNSSAPQRRK